MLREVSGSCVLGSGMHRLSAAPKGMRGEDSQSHRKTMCKWPRASGMRTQKGATVRGAAETAPGSRSASNVVLLSRRVALCDRCRAAQTALRSCIGFGIWNAAPPESGMMRPPALTAIESGPSGRNVSDARARAVAASISSRTKWDAFTRAVSHLIKGR